MSIARALPFLLLALVLGVAGYLAGAVTDPFTPTQTRALGDLSPEAPRLQQELRQARQETTDLTEQLERAQETIERLRGEVQTARDRAAALQRRADTAEEAQANAQSESRALAERADALDSRATSDRTVPETSGGTSSADTAVPEQPADAAPLPTDDTADTAIEDDAANAGPETAAPNESADDAATTDNAPPSFDSAPQPGPQAISAISPSTQQANRLVVGVQAYQDGDYEAAFDAWLPLAQAGYARAQLHLGALFLEGRGTQQDDPLAHAWLTIAQDNGSQNAGPLLDRLRAEMTPAELQAAEQLVARARQSAAGGG